MGGTRERDACTAFVGTFRALDYGFAVRTNDPALAGYLDGILGALRAPTPSSVVYSLVDNGEDALDRYALCVDDETVARSASGSFVVAFLLWHINRQAVDCSGTYTIVHAGAVLTDGGAIVLPGRSGSGKSTLVAGLVRAGLRYLTDEAAAIDPQALRVQPYPRPIALGSGARRVLPEVAPVLDADVERRYAGDEWIVDPRRLGRSVPNDAATPALIVAQQYESSARSHIEPMRRAEALMTLGENAFNLHDRGAAGFKTLAELVRQCTCYRLVVGDLSEACDLVLAAALDLNLRLASGIEGARRAVVLSPCRGRERGVETRGDRTHRRRPGELALLPR